MKVLLELELLKILEMIPMISDKPCIHLYIFEVTVEMAGMCL